MMMQKYCDLPSVKIEAADISSMLDNNPEFESFWEHLSQRNVPDGVKAELIKQQIPRNVDECSAIVFTPLSATGQEQSLTTKGFGTLEERMNLAIRMEVELNGDASKPYDAQALDALLAECP